MLINSYLDLLLYVFMVKEVTLIRPKIQKKVTLMRLINCSLTKVLRLSEKDFLNSKIG